jgi:hypothetical protein
VTGRLWMSGFDAIAWPAGSTKVVGKIAVGKLESLLYIDAVLRIAPHYR